MEYKRVITITDRGIKLEFFEREKESHYWGCRRGQTVSFPEGTTLAHGEGHYSSEITIVSEYSDMSKCEITLVDER